MLKSMGLLLLILVFAIAGLVGPALAADGTPPTGPACHSFKQANADALKVAPDLLVVKLTPAQRAAVMKASNSPDLEGDVWTVSRPGDHTVLLVVVLDDCMGSVADVPSQVLAELIGQDT